VTGAPRPRETAVPVPLQNAASGPGDLRWLLLRPPAAAPPSPTGPAAPRSVPHSGQVGHPKAGIHLTSSTP